MTSIRQTLAGLAAFAVLGLIAVGGAWALQFRYSQPSPAEYVAELHPHAKLVPTGELTFDGVPFRCGRVPAVLDAKIHDYAEAYFGLIVLNPERFATMSPTLKRYAYAHECGHQYAGYDEGEADCYGIRQGKHDGWLDATALEEICAFISRSKGDAAHAVGLRRCEMMRQCYARARTGREWSRLF